MRLAGYYRYGGWSSTASTWRGSIFHPPRADRSLSVCRQCACFLDDAKSRRSDFYPKLDKWPRKVSSREEKKKKVWGGPRPWSTLLQSIVETHTNASHSTVGKRDRQRPRGPDSLVPFGPASESRVVQGAAARRVAVTWCRRRRRSAVLGTGGRLQLPTIYLRATRRPCR